MAMKKPLPLILFAYIAGIVAGNYFYLPFYLAMAGIMGASMALLIFLFRKKEKASLILSPLLFALIGTLYIGGVLHPEFPSHHLIHFSEERRYHIEGVLYRPPELTQEKTRIYVRAEKIFIEEDSFPAAGNLLLTVKERSGDWRYGDRVRFISKLYLPRPATNPGAFDYRKFLALQDIWVTAYANESGGIIRMQEGRGNPFFHFVESRREKIREFLDANAPPHSRGILKALVLGERGDIDPETNEKFIVAGVSHILSISGLHVALVAAFFFGVTRWALKLFPSILLHVPLSKTSACVAVVPVIFYTFIAGMGLAAVRSMIMMLSFLLALLLDREKDLYDALFLAAFLILIASPAALFDVSFQLSFLSVLAILYLVPRLAEYFSFFKAWPLKSWIEEQSRWKRKLLIYTGASLLTSTAAILGTGPLVGYYFNRVSLVGFFSNLLLVPLMGFVNTLLSLVTAFLVFVSLPLAQILITLNVWLLEISLALVDFFSRFPFASRRMSTPTYPELMLLYGILIFGANLKRWRQALPGLVGCVALLASLQIYGYYAVSRGNELSVAFLDVGQGDAAVVTFPQGKIMVIDAGGSLDGSFDPGERIVAPFLWKMKKKDIDYLVNTHSHPDHLQGLLFLLENFRVREVWNNGEDGWGDPLAERFLTTAGRRLQKMRQGKEPLIINGVKVEFLHPPLERKEEPNFGGNNASLVLRLTFGEVSFLFCGDIEAMAEEEIGRTDSNLLSTVIKVPHHGSKTSSTPELVKRVRPRFAVFTVRAGGRNRLPHASVLQRYEERGAKTFLSDRDGTITFKTNGQDLQVQTFLEGGRRSSD